EEGRDQAIQNHRHGKSSTLAIFESPFDVVEERETETAAGEKYSGRRNRYRADQGELTVRLNIGPRSYSPTRRRSDHSDAPEKLTALPPAIVIEMAGTQHDSHGDQSRCGRERHGIERRGRKRNHTAFVSARRLHDV